jgi:hypothetical protein
MHACMHSFALVCMRMRGDNGAVCLSFLLFLPLPSSHPFGPALFRVALRRNPRSSQDGSDALAELLGGQALKQQQHQQHLQQQNGSSEPSALATLVEGSSERPGQRMQQHQQQV